MPDIPRSIGCHHTAGLPARPDLYRHSQPAMVLPLQATHLMLNYALICVMALVVGMMLPVRAGNAQNPGAEPADCGPAVTDYKIVYAR